MLRSYIKYRSEDLNNKNEGINIDAIKTVNNEYKKGIVAFKENIVCLYEIMRGKVKVFEC